MSRERRSRSQQKIWDEVGASLEARRKPVEVGEIEELMEETNIPFVWKGKDATPSDEKVRIHAFELAGRTKMIKKLGEEFLLDNYYITDVLQKLENDSRSIEMKYGEGVKLHDGNSYFLSHM